MDTARNAERLGSCHQAGCNVVISCVWELRGTLEVLDEDWMGSSSPHPVPIQYLSSTSSSPHPVPIQYSSSTHPVPIQSRRSRRNLVYPVLIQSLIQSSSSPSASSSPHPVLPHSCWRQTYEPLTMTFSVLSDSIVYRESVLYQHHTILDKYGDEECIAAIDLMICSSWYGTCPVKALARQRWRDSGQ